MNFVFIIVLFIFNLRKEIFVCFLYRLGLIHNLSLFSLNLDLYSFSVLKFLIRKQIKYLIILIHFVFNFKLFILNLRKKIVWFFLYLLGLIFNLDLISLYLNFYSFSVRIFQILKLINYLIILKKFCL